MSGQSSMAMVAGYAPQSYIVQMSANTTIQEAHDAVVAQLMASSARDGISNGYVPHIQLLAMDRGVVIFTSRDAQTPTMLKSAIIHKLVNEIVYVRHQAGLTVTALGEARQDTQTYLLRLAEAKNWALFWETAANGLAPLLVRRLSDWCLGAMVDLTNIPLAKRDTYKRNFNKFSAKVSKEGLEKTLVSQTSQEIFDFALRQADKTGINPPVWKTEGDSFAHGKPSDLNAAARVILCRHIINKLPPSQAARAEAAYQFLYNSSSLPSEIRSLEATFGI